MGKLMKVYTRKETQRWNRLQLKDQVPYPLRMKQKAIDKSSLLSDNLKAGVLSQEDEKVPPGQKYS